VIGGALSATVGVLVGGWVTRRGQDRQWLRDKQLAAYSAVFDHYAKFTMTLRRAHADGKGWNYDWGEWSSALMAASILSPADVAEEISKFGAAINSFLNVAAHGTTTSPLSPEEFERARRAPAQAQLALVNAIRRSVGPNDRDLPEPLGG
jgi:hypothetical protein